MRVQGIEPRSGSTERARASKWSECTPRHPRTTPTRGFKSRVNGLLRIHDDDSGRKNISREIVASTCGRRSLIRVGRPLRSARDGSGWPPTRSLRETPVTRDNAVEFLCRLRREETRARDAHDVARRAWGPRPKVVLADARSSSRARSGATSRHRATIASASGRDGVEAVKGTAVAAAAALALTLATPDATLAGTPKGQGVLSTDEYGRSDVDRCSIEALKKGASTRAAFSDFATQQNQELYVNIEGCDFSNMDLSGEVLSGVKARGANFRNSIFGPECSRADFSVADLRGAVIRNVNLYNTVFAGANLEGADFTASLASGAFFGKDEQTGELANLKGAVFEDTLLSSSDVTRMCSNKTLDFEGKMNLGC